MKDDDDDKGVDGDDEHFRGMSAPAVGGVGLDGSGMPLLTSSTSFLRARTRHH
jgi:hypothetical protein